MIHPQCVALAACFVSCLAARLSVRVCVQFASARILQVCQFLSCGRWHTNLRMSLILFVVRQIRRVHSLYRMFLFFALHHLSDCYECFCAVAINTIIDQPRSRELRFLSISAAVPAG